MTVDETNALGSHWRRLRSLLTQAADTGLPPDVQGELDELRGELLWSLFSGPPMFNEQRPDIARDDPRLTVALDILAALTVADPDESSYPWERGGLLFTIGRHLEAADDYLAAADRFGREAAAGTGATSDEADWRDAAFFHAATNFVLGGHALAGAALLSRLADEDRAKVTQLIEDATAPVSG